MKLHKLLLLFTLLVLFTGCSNTTTKEEIEIPGIILFENANSRNTYFTVHNIREAWRYSKGAGVKVGILDFSFGYDEHSSFYAGGLSFQKGQYRQLFYSQTHHGYWMASTLHEVAPDADIYALGVISNNEDDQVQSMIEAIEWAIENKLDILTYSSARISEKNRILLDEALERAYDHGIITTFIHHPNPKNLLPSPMKLAEDEIEINPPFSIFKYDYSILFPEMYIEYIESGKRSIPEPFMSISSTSPVLAGFVAMIKSVNPNLSSDEISKLLVDTSYTYETEDTYILNAVNIGATVRTIVNN